MLRGISKRLFEPLLLKCTLHISKCVAIDLTFHHSLSRFRGKSNTDDLLSVITNDTEGLHALLLNSVLESNILCLTLRNASNILLVG